MGQPRRAEPHLGDAQAGAFAEQNIFWRNRQAVELQFAMAAMLLRPHDRDAPRDPPARLVLVKQEGRESAPRIVGRAGDQDEIRGFFGAGDEPFPAEDAVGAVRLFLGAGLHHAWVRAAARMRFCHDEGGADLAARDGREPALLLRGRPCEFENHHVAVVRRGAVEGGRTEDRAVHRLVADRHADAPDAEAAAFRLELKQPQALGARFLANLRQQIDADVLMRVVGGGIAFQRDQAAVDEGRDALAKLVERGRDREIHGEPQREETRWPPSTGMAAPVMAAPASEQSSRSAPSRSLGFSRRRCGMRLTSACPASVAKKSRLKSVST